MEKFRNKKTGETLIHRDRRDGKRDLKVVKTGVSGDRGAHSVIKPDNVPSYDRDSEGNVTVDDEQDE